MSGPARVCSRWRAVAAAWEIADAHFLGDPVSAVLADPTAALYAALDLGHFGAKLWRRERGGAWRELAVPAFPPKPEDAGDDPHPWSLGKIWALEPGGVAGPAVGRHDARRAVPLRRRRRVLVAERGAVAYARAPAMVRRRRRRAARHQLGAGRSARSRRHPRRRVAARACGPAPTRAPRGGSSTRACTTNTCRRSGARTRSCRTSTCWRTAPAHPEIVWCQHHNGVFRSENAGANWRELTAIRPSKFGFAVAAHPRDPDTAWFVPAVKDERRVPVDGKVVVARTRDGGRSFEVLSKGLPQRHAYDLVWRHALAVDETGERLAFGSTSGGLWISEDGGDSWTMPEARLPPIAAVRFAPAAH